MFLLNHKCYRMLSIMVFMLFGYTKNTKFIAIRLRDNVK